MNSTNIIKQDYKITATDRIKLLKQKPVVLWFTGLSGSGKSTLADRIEQELAGKGHLTYLLDGDNIRHGLNKDLDFSEEGRRENIRRIAEVSKLFMDAGIIVLTAFISPFREDREQARKITGKDFIEIFVDCPLEVCESRDVKGLYAKARQGEITNFTGISSPFEKPENPEITVNTAQDTLETCVNQILQITLNRINLL